MRKSRYVIEAEGPHGESLLFNAANGAFVQLGLEGRTLWGNGTFDAFVAPAAAADSAANVASAITDPTTLDALETLQLFGFLTDLTPEQELQAQREAFDRQRADTTSMTLSFIPTYACNFRCPYCYELGHNKIPGKMDERMMDVIVEFVRNCHAVEGFKSLSVQWYGGDPSLALDVVQALTEKLTRFCDAQGIAYDAMMLTNANVIDEPEAQLIADCRISSMFLTIDGPEEIHNKRRVAANGSNSYERTIQAARLLRERGLKIRANMNADKVTLPLYADLREKLLAEEGIELTFGKLNDYGHFFGRAPFCRPDFDLYDHEEFFRAQFEEFAKLPHSAEEMREMLRPPGRFCTGQANNYFVIDLLGNVYKCDGWVGDREHVRFNLLDDPSTWKLDEVSFDPTRDARCSACNLMPLCLGSCIWERELSGMPCHPFKTTIGDYLRIYYNYLNASADSAAHGKADCGEVDGDVVREKVGQSEDFVTVLAV